MDDFIPIAKVDITEAECEAVAAVLRSGWLTTGPRTRKFEEHCRDFLGCRFTLAVNSCTAALHLAVSALGIGPGDEVITTPLTFAATVNSILYVGATPVLADVEPNTLNLDPAATAEKITPRTKALIVVHYGGAPVDLDAFEQMAREHGIPLIEDAAHAMGARYRGRRIGASSRAACFSFHPVKNMTTGEGGLLATDEEGVEHIARLRSWHGIDKSALNRFEKNGSWYYEVQEIGFKYNMTDLQAAIGIEQLARLDASNAQRRAIAAEYDACLQTLPGVRVAPDPQDSEGARHLYWMVLDPNRYDRGGFIDAMRERDIGCGVHYIPIHLHPYYQKHLGWCEGLCPVAEHSYRGLVTIPLFHGMAEAQWRRVIETVPAALAEARR